MPHPRSAIALGACLASLVSLRSASAEPPRPPAPLVLEPEPPIERARDRVVRRPARWSLLLGESAGLLLVPTIYYWSTTSVQKEDWELDWDWPSWELKLTSLDAVSFDTGDWQSNAMRHPYIGALTYQVGRANGYGPIGSTVVDVISSVAWEYVVEYKERVSLNDLVVNTMSGFLLGEPLFQLGRIGDQPGANWGRRAIATMVSPFHRLHAGAGYTSWTRGPPPWTRFELAVGGSLGGHGATVREEATVGIDLELVADRRYRTPGTATRWTAAGTFNRLAATVRTDELGEPSMRVQSRTTYGGYYARDLDDAGHGTDRFVGAAAGIDYETRHLAEEWDRFAVFHLIGPRLAFGSWGETSVTAEAAAYGDLAMVQAHVFGPVPPFSPMPQTSVLQSRGYYFATGTSLAVRIRAEHHPWTADLEGRGHAMWSIDNLDRVELDGVDGDPHDVADQRLLGRAALGVQPADRADVRLELSVEGVVRRGTWSTLHRETAELSGGLALVFGF
jgi:hypothetical protein